MNKVVTLEVKTTGKGTSGGMKPTWAALADGSNVFAWKRDLNGNEAPATNKGGVAGKATVEFGLRYLPGVVPVETRVVFEGLNYRIIHANNVDSGNETLVLTCETGVKDV